MSRLGIIVHSSLDSSLARLRFCWSTSHTVHLQVVSSGVKMFEKNSQSTMDMSGAEYRLSQDGEALIA